MRYTSGIRFFSVQNGSTSAWLSAQSLHRLIPVSFGNAIVEAAAVPAERRSRVGLCMGYALERAL